MSDLMKYVILVLSFAILSACGGGGGGGTPTFELSGTVSGLNGTVTLQNNGTDSTELTGNGNFTVSTSVADGTAYNITVLTQPASQTCTITNGSGTLAGSDVSDIQLTCIENSVVSFSLGGTVSGLTGTVVLQNNGGDDLTVSNNGGFTFATELSDASAYSVSVLSQPASQSCSLNNASGSISSADVNNVTLSCVTISGGSAFSVGGTVSGLSDTLVLQNNGGDNLTITADGNFTFGTELNDSAAYSVAVLTQPSGQTCSLSNNSGIVSGADVSNVTVNCSSNPMPTFSIGGSVSGLNDTLVLQNNAGDDLTLTADGSFTFATELNDSVAFTVTVLTQPTDQTCSLSNETGSISGADVTNLVVTCTNNSGEDSDDEANLGVMNRVYTKTLPLGRNNALPKQAITSYLDDEKLLHVAWIETLSEDNFVIKYGTYSESGSFNEVSISHDQFDLIFSVSMVVDGNGKVHIVFQGKRDVDVSCCKSGNYAIYYASNQSGSFVTSQVSSNPLDAFDDTDTLYAAYVNGRPDIFLDEAGNVNIIYVADANSENSYDQHAVIATESGSGWSLNQAFSIENFQGSYSHSHEFFASRKVSTSGPFVWMDISDYNVHAVQNGIDNMLSGYGGYTQIKDVQAIDDNNGNHYAVWLREATDEENADDYAFYISEVLSSGLSNPIRVPIDTNAVASNFAPAAIDPVTGKFYLFYSVGGFTLTSQHILEFDPSTLQVETYDLPEDIGVPYGHDSLWAYDGMVSYVGANDWEQLKISILNVAEPSTPSPLEGQFLISPVAGMSYETETQSGSTGLGGGFKYFEGETVTFKLGDIELPAVSASELVTALQIFNTTDPESTQIVNLTRLLMSLDADADISNGVAISQAAYDAAIGVSLSFDNDSFETDALALLDKIESLSVLVPDFIALTYLREIQNEEQEDTEVVETLDFSLFDGVWESVSSGRRVSCNSENRTCVYLNEFDWSQASNISSELPDLVGVPSTIGLNYLQDIVEVDGEFKTKSRWLRFTEDTLQFEYFVFPDSTITFVSDDEMEIVTPTGPGTLLEDLTIYGSNTSVLVRVNENDSSDSIVGNWDFTDGDGDEYYVVITESEWIVYDYMGDSYDMGEDCYSTHTEYVTDLGGGTYRVTDELGYFDDLELSRSGDNIVLGGRYSFPPSSISENAYTPICDF